MEGKLGNPAFLEEYSTEITSLTVAKSSYEVEFEWNEEMRFPGAVLVKNHNNSEFYLETIILEDVPGHGQVHFDCNSWVYPFKCYTKKRIFFPNKVSLALFFCQYELSFIIID